MNHLGITTKQTVSANTGKEIMKNAIIFGVTGQDGSYLAELLIDKGYKVYGVARRASTDNTARIKHLLGNTSFSLLCGDVTDFTSVLTIIRDVKPQHIYNLSAQSHVKISFEQPVLTWDITAKGALNILEAIRLTDTSIRFYQASTSEMFGNQMNHDENGLAYQDENTPMNPRSPYSVAKMAAHNFTRLYRDSYNLHASSGILFNHESPRRGEMFVTRKITKFVGEFGRKFQWYLEHGFTESEALNDMKYETPLFLGNIDAYRDWGHARDYCKAMILMLEQEKPDDYVISTGVTTSVRDFLTYCFDEIGVKDWTPFVEIDPSLYRPAEVPYLRGVSTKARKQLGWEPEYSVKMLAQEMVKHDLTHYDPKIA